MRYFKIKYGTIIEYYRVSPDGSYEFYVAQMGWYGGFRESWKAKVESHKSQEVSLLELLVKFGKKAVSA